MIGVTSAVAWLALFLSTVALFVSVRNYRQTRRTRERSIWDDEQLLRTAWLQEIEARGQMLLEQFAAVEQRLQQQKISPDSVVFSPLHSPASAPEQEPPDTATAAPPRPMAQPTTVAAAADETVTSAHSDLYTTASANVTSVRRTAMPAVTAPPTVAERVHQLAAAGHDVAEIARRLNMGGGEVELILSLRTRDETEGPTSRR